MNPAVQYRWRALRRVATSYRINAYIVIAFGGLIVLAILLEWGGSTPLPSGLASFESGVGALLACGFVALVTSGIATGLFAKAEFIELMIAVEENTRAVAMSVSQTNLVPAPPQQAPQIWPTLLPED